MQVVQELIASAYYFYSCEINLGLSKAIIIWGYEDISGLVTWFQLILQIFLAERNAQIIWFFPVLEVTQETIELFLHKVLNLQELVEIEQMCACLLEDLILLV